ncbi:MAG: hypothetical protein V1723_04735 [Candidatus Uhrbacteria bacterium]
MFPVYLKRDPDDPLPEEQYAYIVGRNGAFLKTECVAFRAVVPTSALPTLAEVKEEATYLLPPIPAVMVARTIAFFRAVYRASGSEAILLVAYDPVAAEFRLVAPLQQVGPGHLHYEVPYPPPAGCRFVGTIHSHGDGGAWHSGVDKRDEVKFDGIHATFGRVDKEAVDISAELSVAGRRFPQSLECVFGGLRRIESQVGEIVPSTATASTRSPRRMRLPVAFQTPDDLIAWGKRLAWGRRHQGPRPEDYSVNPQPTALAPSYSIGHLTYQPAGYVVDLPEGTDPSIVEPDPVWFEAVETQAPEPAYHELSDTDYEVNPQRSLGSAESVGSTAVISSPLDGSPNGVVGNQGGVEAADDRWNEVRRLAWEWEERFGVTSRSPLNGRLRPAVGQQSDVEEEEEVQRARKEENPWPKEDPWWE